MQLKPDYALYLNIFLVILFVTTMIQSTKKGLLRSLIGFFRFVVSLIIAILAAGACAEVFPLTNFKTGSLPLVLSAIFEQYSSTVIWFVILFLGSYLLTKVVDLSFKFVDSIPIINTVNYIGGFVVGFFLAWLKSVILITILTLPFFSNGQALISASWLNPIYESTRLIDSYTKMFNLNTSIQDINSNKSIDDKNRVDIQELLSEYGLSQAQIVEFLEGFK